VESRHGDGDLRARFPLELISPKNHNSMNSTFGNRDDVDAETLTATIHPEDAQARGVASGDQIRVFNGRGSLLLRAAVADTVLRGVVSAPSVRWPSRGADRRNVNALTSQRLTDIGGGPTFYSCLVEVEKIGD
jgi:anaerobic selenocysteine-containing dehydrogenase